MARSAAVLLVLTLLAMTGFMAGSLANGLTTRGGEANSTSDDASTAPEWQMELAESFSGALNPSRTVEHSGTFIDQPSRVRKALHEHRDVLTEAERDSFVVELSNLEMAPRGPFVALEVRVKSEVLDVSSEWIEGEATKGTDDRWLVTYGTVCRVLVALTYKC